MDTTVKTKKDMGYIMKTLQLRDGRNGPDRTNWERLEQIGWTPIEIWRLGVWTALTQEHNKNSVSS